MIKKRANTHSTIKIGVDAFFQNIMTAVNMGNSDIPAVSQTRSPR